jgi:N-acetylmuramoyl-L-alanine amidase
MTRAIIIGHHVNGKGAYSEYFKMYEYDFWLMQIDKLKCNFDVYLHNSDIASYTARMRQTAKRVYGKYELILALHFNSFNGQAQGCEALHLEGNKKAKELCHKYTYLVNEAMDIRDRGAKPLNSKSRGFHEIAHTDCTTILLEPFFGDNPSDCKKFDIDKHIEILQQL